jgi:hypothetical protein
MQCEKCGRQLRSISTRTICMRCKRTCACGALIDRRAVRCWSCASKLKATAQWADPAKRERIHSAVKAFHQRTRTKLSDLTEAHFHPRTAIDGRFWSWYWDEEGRHRAIYRYQWRWLKEYGTLPRAKDIHHKNGNCTDDRLENLEALTHAQHMKLHGLPKRTYIEWTCANCRCRFKRRKRGRLERKYCSRRCAAITRGRKQSAAKLNSAKAIP